MLSEFACGSWKHQNNPACMSESVFTMLDEGGHRVLFFVRLGRGVGTNKQNQCFLKLQHVWQTWIYSSCNMRGKHGYTQAATWGANMDILKLQHVWQTWIYSSCNMCGKHGYTQAATCVANMDILKLQHEGQAWIYSSCNMRGKHGYTQAATWGANITQHTEI